MKKKHNFIRLAEAQLASETLYCAGLDIHSFGGFKNNMNVYGFETDGQMHSSSGSYSLYEEALSFTDIDRREIPSFAGLLTAIEEYITLVVVRTAIDKCNIRVFKPQLGLYIQFGPIGLILLKRIKNFIKMHGQVSGKETIIILDCKPGDIATTQAGYFLGFMGNLKESWGIDYSPFDFDIINPTPWMGEDVLVLQDKKSKKRLLGLELLEQGKGLIFVNKTSNPSGPQYQELIVPERGGKTLAMCNAEDAYEISQKYDLEAGGLSQIGLVIGATYPCDGSIRKAFPTYTGLNPGFGAQEGKFENVMLELIPKGPWNGLGAIFSSSRGTLFPWEKKYGGSGKIENLEKDLIAAVNRHREQEEAAYHLAQVIEAGIRYPFGNEN